MKADDSGRQRRIDCAVLMKRAYAIDVLRCPRCAGPMRLVAVIQDERVARRILEHLGLPAKASAVVRAVPRRLMGLLRASRRMSAFEWPRPTTGSAAVLSQKRPRGALLPATGGSNLVGGNRVRAKPARGEGLASPVGIDSTAQRPLLWLNFMSTWRRSRYERRRSSGVAGWRSTRAAPRGAEGPRRRRPRSSSGAAADRRPPRRRSPL